MLLTLNYHQVGLKRYGNPLEMLENHFKWIKDRFPVILPGDPIKRFKMQLCLSFDDATYDFYAYIFPLLKKLDLKAVLAVPTGLIVEDSDLEPAKRLQLLENLSFKQSPAFCTWKELKKMHDSGHVMLASHTHFHTNLVESQTTLESEVLNSKKILETKIKSPVTTFVYPYGQLNTQVHRFVRKHYPHVMRLGSSLNWGWKNCHTLIYRINGDQLRSPKAPFSFSKILLYTCRFFLNTLRFR